MAINIANQLAKIKELKEQEKKIKAEMRAEKSAVIKEYTSGISEEQKQGQIKEAEKILATAQKDMLTAREHFKITVKGIRERVTLAKDILELVHYEQHNSLPKVKNSIAVIDGFATIARDGMQSVKVDTSKADWQKTLIAELAKQGIDNGIARNIAYKTSLAVKSNV